LLITSLVLSSPYLLVFGDDCVTYYMGVAGVEGEDMDA